MAQLFHLLQLEDIPHCNALSNNPKLHVSFFWDSSMRLLKNQLRFFCEFFLIFFFVKAALRPKLALIFSFAIIFPFSFVIFPLPFRVYAFTFICFFKFL
jgi:hypothetical protein